MSDQSTDYIKQNPLGGPARIFDAVADAIRAGDSIKSAMAQFGLAWAAPSVDRNGGKTGHPPGMLQDDSRKLTKWFAGKPDARLRVREAAAAIAAQAEPPLLSDFDATLRNYAEAVRKLDGPAMRAGYIKLRKMLTGQAEPPQAAQREVREVVEQLIACHDEAACPAVAVAREWLAAQPASLAAPAQPEVPPANDAHVAIGCQRFSDGAIQTQESLDDAMKPQAGEWTLIAPDGRSWNAESPLRVCGKEQRERIPAEVALKRIFAAIDEEAEPSPPADTPTEAQGTDDAQFARLIAKGAEAWKDVPNATQWVDELRGDLPDAQGEREALSDEDIDVHWIAAWVKAGKPKKETMKMVRYFARAILAAHERNPKP